jgi:RNA polymerase sigma-70 factor (ECF subfamily)
MTKFTRSLNFLPVVSLSQLPDDLRAIYDAEVGNVVNSLRRLGARGSDLEDLTQEVFVRAFQQLPGFDRTRALRPWLFGIALRVMAEARRHTWKLRPAGESEASDQVADPGVTPERAAEIAQTRRLVLDLLEELAPERRAVFVMYELNGDSMTEIAEALGIPLFTAYSRLRVARAQFAALVRERHPSLPDAGGKDDSK